jgi:hypothetical protein
MKVFLKSKNRSTLVNTLGYDSSRDYTYIRLVNIKGCAGEYLHYSLPCVKIHCQRAGMGWRWKVYSHGVGVYRFKMVTFFFFFQFCEVAELPIIHKRTQKTWLHVREQSRFFLDSFNIFCDILEPNV